VAAYWSAKAKDYIAHHFGQWLRLLLIKLRNIWSAFQYDDLSIITNLREQGVLPPGLNFGIVAAFAVPGMFLGWRIAPRSRWITAAILLHIAALLTVFITERYRLPLVPGLLIFAAFGLALFWRSCIARDFRLVRIYLVLLGASAIFVSWPQRDPSLWALDAYNSGWQALESNDLPLAEKKLALAYAYVPNNAETNFAVGNLRFAQDQRQAAVAWYGRALQIDPKHKGALNNLGVIALDANDLPTAKRFFEQALKQDPRSGKTHYLLAKTLKTIGALPEAGAEIARAIEIDPNQQEFLELKRAIDRDR
jgi:tetratricopeptide (TPR) repeat protein